MLLSYNISTASTPEPPLRCRFEDLDREFAVGVVSSEGQHVLIDAGPLPEAVAASAAIPVVFSAVEVPGDSPGTDESTLPNMHSRV